MAQHTEWTPALRDALHEPFPAEWHKTKKQGGAEITFVEWHRYALRLNDLVGPDGWEVRLRFLEVGGKLIATASLTILGVTKENVGDEDEEKDSYGTASTNSFAQAYKRAAALFGMGLYMYDKAGRESATRAPRNRTLPAQTDRRSAPSGKQPWEKLMPFGSQKGKALGDLPPAELKRTLDWCRQKDAEKFADLIADLEATLAQMAA